VGPLDEASRADRQVLTLHHPVLLQPLDEARRVVEALTKLRAQVAELAGWFQRQPPVADTPGESL
jgi:hypothetical protein